MEYEEEIRSAKYLIAGYKDRIIKCVQVLGGRGESSIIRSGFSRCMV